MTRRTASCPYPDKGCKWKGSLNQIKLHLMQEHKSTPRIARYACTFCIVKWISVCPGFGLQSKAIVGNRSHYPNDNNIWINSNYLKDKKEEIFQYQPIANQKENVIFLALVQAAKGQQVYSSYHLQLITVIVNDVIIPLMWTNWKVPKSEERDNNF